MVHPPPFQTLSISHPAPLYTPTLTTLPLSQLVSSASRLPFPRRIPRSTGLDSTAKHPDIGREGAPTLRTVANITDDFEGVILKLVKVDRFVLVNIYIKREGESNIRYIFQCAFVLILCGREFFQLLYFSLLGWSIFHITQSCNE